MKHDIPIIGLLLAAVCGHAAEVSLNPPVFLPDGQEFKTWAPRLEFSRTYHVDQRHPKASDQNPGTAELPLRTIGRATDPRDAPGAALCRPRAHPTCIQMVFSSVYCSCA